MVLSSPEVVLGDVDCAGCLKPRCGGRSLRGAYAGGRGRWLRLKLQGSVEEPEKAQLVRWGTRRGARGCRSQGTFRFEGRSGCPS